MLCANYIHFESPAKKYGCHKNKMKKKGNAIGFLLLFFNVELLDHSIDYCFSTCPFHGFVSQKQKKKKLLIISSVSLLCFVWTTGPHDTFPHASPSHTLFYCVLYADG